MSGELPKHVDPNHLDPDVVSRAFEEHRSAIERFAFGILRDAAQAADVAQTTFTKLLEHGGVLVQSGLFEQTGTVESSTRIRAWLFRVAFNESMSVRRKAAVEKRVLERLGWQTGSQNDLTGSRPGASSPIEDREFTEVVLARLPPELRTVVQLRIHENQKFIEIAQKLNLPLGTVLTRMRSALGQLKKMWKSD